MLEVVLLVCALSIPPKDCTEKNATIVIHGPTVSNGAMCGFMPQSYLAPSALARWAEEGGRPVIRCTEREPAEE